MTDAKEPEVITQLLHSEECGRSVLYDVYGNAICIIAAILNHIDAITRERDALRTVAKDAIRYMVFEVVACHGLKCREGSCESCCDEDDAKAFVLESREVISTLTAALSEATP